MECIANMAGCILADIAAPAYAGYGLRAQDGGARLDLLRGIVSLHGVDGDASTREARLRRFWTDTRSRNRAALRGRWTSRGSAAVRCVARGLVEAAAAGRAAAAAAVAGLIPLRRSRRAVSCRSEEHTSELQSLMRSSYAVFCLTT